MKASLDRRARRLVAVVALAASAAGAAFAQGQPQQAAPAAGDPAAQIRTAVETWLQGRFKVDGVRRSAVYDFDLMDREPSGELAETPLRELTCVVFDTETTGLLPSSGDEIVQIAALRLLGGKRIPGEEFESLVNPERPIPAAATEVHHVTNAMVADAPTIADVGRRFQSRPRPPGEDDLGDPGHQNIPAAQQRLSLVEAATIRSTVSADFPANANRCHISSIAAPSFRN